MKSFKELKERAREGQSPEASPNSRELADLQTQLSEAVSEARKKIAALEDSIVEALRSRSKFNPKIFFVADIGYRLMLNHRLQEGSITLEQITDIPGYEEVVNFWQELRRNGYPVVGHMSYDKSPPYYLNLTINLDIRSRIGE